MGFFLGTCVMHNIFLCRHKSSNRVQPIYQTSPEQYQEQKEDYIFIYFYIEPSLLFLPARLLYMCDPAILLFHPLPHQILNYWTNYIHCRLSATCVKSNYFQRASVVSPPKFTCRNGICPFSTFLCLSSKGMKRPNVSIQARIDLLFCHILLLC